MEATYYKWESKYGGMEASDLMRVKELEAENAKLKRMYADLAIQYIQPAKPNQNAYVEPFNRTFRGKLLDQHLFATLDNVREAVQWWMIDYNEEQPQDALNDLTPEEARRQSARNSTYQLSP